MAFVLDVASEKASPRRRVYPRPEHQRGLRDGLQHVTFPRRDVQPLERRTFASREHVFRPVEQVRRPVRGGALPGGEHQPRPVGDAAEPSLVVLNPPPPQRGVRVRRLEHRARQPPRDGVKQLGCAESGSNGARLLGVLRHRRRAQVVRLKRADALDDEPGCLRRRRPRRRAWARHRALQDTKELALAIPVAARRVDGGRTQRNRVPPARAASTSRRARLQRRHRDGDAGTSGRRGMCPREPRRERARRVSGRESDRLRRGRLRRGRRRQPRPGPAAAPEASGSGRKCACRPPRRLGIAEGHRAVGVPDHVVRQARHIRGEHDRFSGDAALGVVRGVHHRGEVVQARQVFHRRRAASVAAACAAASRTPPTGRPFAASRALASSPPSPCATARRTPAVHRLRAALDADHLNNLRLEQRAALGGGDDGVDTAGCPGCAARVRSSSSPRRRGAHHRALRGRSRARSPRPAPRVRRRTARRRSGWARRGRRRGGETRAFRRPGRRRERGGSLASARVGTEGLGAGPLAVTRDRRSFVSRRRGRERRRREAPSAVAAPRGAVSRASLPRRFRRSR